VAPAQQLIPAEKFVEMAITLMMEMLQLQEDLVMTKTPSDMTVVTTVWSKMVGTVKMEALMIQATQLYVMKHLWMEKISVDTNAM